MALDELSYRFHPQWVTLSPWLFVGSRTRGTGQTSSKSQRVKQIWCLFAATLPSPPRTPPLPAVAESSPQTDARLASPGVHPGSSENCSHLTDEEMDGHTAGE